MSRGSDLVSAGPRPLLGASCRWRAEDPDRNAIIYDAGGRVLVEETIGDGIEHVFTTNGGRVWVGYFDEGVYGNFGWGPPSGPPPIGAPGLVRFTSELKPDWRYPTHGETWGDISDCYALNVDGETAWTCYYDDFPIVRIQDGELTEWRNDIDGVKALVVDGSGVALCGGYAADVDRMVIGNLDDEQFHATKEFRLTLPGRRSIAADAQIVGRGADLRVISDGDWYRLDLDQIWLN